MAHTRLARIFIGGMALAAAAAIATTALRGQTWHPFLALTLLAIAAVTSRMKVKIPGCDGSMSVNLPFLLLSVVALSAAESILIACISTVVQSVPKKGDALKPVKMLFNVSMMACASNMAAVVCRQDSLARLGQHPAPLLLIVATLTFFLAQTVPVSIIIALTDGGAIRRIWQSIAQMVFPYFVASAGVTALVNLGGNHIGWVAAMALLPVMYGIYRSYRMYFAASAQAVCAPLTRAAAAGASRQ